ncbi:MAG: PAS domain S-box protein [Pseudomonadota bacterium]
MTAMGQTRGAAIRPTLKGLGTAQKVAAAFTMLAILIALVSLAGWVLDAPRLYDFGIARQPAWPLTSIGYCLLGAGFLAFGAGRISTANWLLAIVLLIALHTVFEEVTGVRTGLDIVFGGGHADLAGMPGGRPAVSTAAIFALLSIAGLGSARQAETGQPEAASLLPGAALVLGALAIATAAFSTPLSLTSHLLASSLPGALSGIFLAGALIAWHGDLSGLFLFTSHRSNRRARLFITPLVLLFPVIPSLIELWVEQTGLMNPLASEAMVIFLNVLILSVLAYWAINRLARDQTSLSELTQALDGTAVATTTTDGRITHWARGSEELYGFTAAEAVGQNKYALLQSRCQQSWRVGLPQPGEEGSMELVEITKDGREIAVLERRHTFENPRGEPLVVLTLNDITMRVEAMQALQVSQERLALATSAHELGVLEWDVRTGAIEWSPGTEVRLGLPTGALSTFEQWRTMTVTEDVQLTLDTIARAVATQADRFSFRFRLRTPQSGIRYVEGSSRAFYDDEGNLQRTVGVVLDVTEREEREAALRGSEAQLLSVLETVPDAMVVVDSRGTVRRFSATAEAIWGYRAADVVGRNFSMLAPEEERAHYLTALDREGGAVDNQFIGHVVTSVGEGADGRRFPVEVRTGLAEADGTFLFTMFFREISERLAAEERLSGLNAELAHVSRQSAMSELAADLAHELNQPLSATSNFLAAARMLLERGEQLDRAIELLRMGADQTQRAGEIIRRLREFMAKREVDMRAELLDRTVRDAVELVLVGTGQFHIKLSYDLDPAARLIFADRIQVQQLLVNLLRNAIDALRASPQSERMITVGSSLVNDQTVEIFVSDSGPGIPETVLRDLYTRFVTTKEGSGMGIGLSISRRIIEAHGGTLSAENKPEGGAIFRFTLPAMGEVGEE